MKENIFTRKMIYYDLETGLKKYFYYYKMDKFTYEIFVKVDFKKYKVGDSVRPYGDFGDYAKVSLYTDLGGWKSYFLHRIIYSSLVGNIRKGYVVHHVDGNPLNNELHNLKTMRREKHTRYHFQEFRELRGGGYR